MDRATQTELTLRAVCAARPATEEFRTGLGKLRAIERCRTEQNDDLHILREAPAAGLVICAWGGWGKLGGRGSQVTNMLRLHKIKLHTLKISSGVPTHPLYLSYDRQPEEWVA